MIRFGTCIIAALAFLGILFAIDFVLWLAFHLRLFGTLPLVVTGHFLGLVRMRAIANRSRIDEQEAEEQRHRASLPHTSYRRTV